MSQSASYPSNDSGALTKRVGQVLSFTLRHGEAGLSVMDHPPSMIGVGRIGRGGMRLIRHLNRILWRGTHEKSAKGVSHA